MRKQWMSLTLLAALSARPAQPAPLTVPSLEAVEEVQLDLTPEASFEIHDLGAAAVTARSPFLLSFRHARLAPGKVLRISVSLDPTSAPGTRLSFEPSGSQGGTCRAGSLLPGIAVPVFESDGRAEAGGCELRWTLIRLVQPRHAGTVPLTLHWKLESAAVPGSESRGSWAPGGRGDPGMPGPSGDRPAAGTPVRGEPRRDIERPERGRPPG